MKCKKYNELVTKQKGSRFADIENNLVGTRGERRGGRGNTGIGD